MEAPDTYPPIGDYAIVGDCHTAALISRAGSVDWFCPGRFDAPAVLCRLLDWQRGGYLSVAPTTAASSARAYREPTNVLDTTFTTADGQARITDFLPLAPQAAPPPARSPAPTNRLVRLVEGLRGATDLAVRFKPTFDYARAQTTVDVVAGQGAVARAGDLYLTLASPGLELANDGRGTWQGHLRVAAGERAWVTLTTSSTAAAAQAALAPPDPSDDLPATLAYWEQWSAQMTYRGPYRAEVLRSALALKLLTYEPTGALLAAPTTSLPEEVGGVRNWDYRFTWLRDSSFILYALLTIGYTEEATDFFGWLARTCRIDGNTLPQPLYAVDGASELTETLLNHLEGYRGSRPVRIGNAAAGQHQLDVLGEVLAAAYLLYRPRVGRRGAAQSGAPHAAACNWPLLAYLVDLAAAHWAETDAGIWEVRGGPQHFLYSKLMCWVALDRGIRLAVGLRQEAPLARWRTARAAVRRAILNRGFDRGVGAFTQAFGSHALDASALAIPRVGFLPATDPRVQSTVEHIRDALTNDGLVWRYRSEDGLRGGEATFALCSFWLVDGLSLGGRLEEAHDLFERTVSYANDVGLLSEEIAPRKRMMLGNFPQAFTHLALVGAAVNLAKIAKHGAEDRRENEGQRADRAAQAAAEGQFARPRREETR